MSSRFPIESSCDLQFRLSIEMLLLALCFVFVHPQLEESGF